jgi:hypothetical protein
MPAQARALKEALGWGLDEGQSFTTALGDVLPPAGMDAKAAALAGVA